MQSGEKEKSDDSGSAALSGIDSGRLVARGGETDQRRERWADRLTDPNHHRPSDTICQMVKWAEEKGRRKGKKKMGGEGEKGWVTRLNLDSRMPRSLPSLEMKICFFLVFDIAFRHVDIFFPGKEETR